MNMTDVLDFVKAALPWITFGLLLAVFFARTGSKKTKETEDYGTEGMCLGMCLGTALNQSYGMCLGMLLGLVIGTMIPGKGAKEENNEETKREE